MLIQPETIHPALWRGAQMSRVVGPCISTGYADLDASLPGGGWPQGNLIDLLLAQPGIGEMRLLQPMLQQLLAKQSDACPVILLNPPYEPNAICWAKWQLPTDRLLLIRARKPKDSAWIAEQILRSNHCTALLCWLDPIRQADLRRLHLLAQGTESLFLTFRPMTTKDQASPAPLRLSLHAIFDGLEISVFKRRGPVLKQIVRLNWYGTDKPQIPGDRSLDRSTPQRAQSERLAAALAHRA